MNLVEIERNEPKVLFNISNIYFNKKNKKVRFDRNEDLNKYMGLVSGCYMTPYFDIINTTKLYLKLTKNKININSCILSSTKTGCDTMFSIYSKHLFNHFKLKSIYKNGTEVGFYTNGDIINYNGSMFLEVDFQDYLI